MKLLKKSLSLFLAMLMLLSCLGAGAAATEADKAAWDAYWQEDAEAIDNAVTMFPGSDETQRYIAWYSAYEKGYVEYSYEGGEAVRVEAQSKKTAIDDYRLGVLLTDLKAGEYTYRCVSEDFISKQYSFTVENSDKFTAVYVTDIHSSFDEANENSLRDTNYNFNKTLEAADNKALKQGNTLDLIVSGGDQAGQGLRSEYVSLSSPELIKTIPFATAIGNHDRKSVDYKYYTYLPNEGNMIFKSYIGADYWFTQGDALFLMLDSCNTSMTGHWIFMKNAIKANPDAKWVIAVMHHDLFGGREPWLYTENDLLRVMWTPLFDEFGVDLCLYGHSHFYSVSNVIYDNKSVQGLAGLNHITDPKGTIYLASGSINNLAPMLDDDGKVPPVGENAAFTYLEQDQMYNLLEFGEDTLEIKSYTVNSDKEFYSLTIEKTSNEGGHNMRNSKPLFKLLFFITRIVNIINNYDMYSRYKEQGYDVTVFEGLIGS